MLKFILLLLLLLTIISFGLAYIFNTTLKDNYLELERELLYSKLEYISTILDTKQKIEKNRGDRESIIKDLTKLATEQHYIENCALIVFTQEGELLLSTHKGITQENFATLKNKSSHNLLYKELLKSITTNLPTYVTPDQEEIAWVRYNNYYNFNIAIMKNSNSLEYNTLKLIRQIFYLTALILVSVFILGIFYFDEIMISPIKEIVSNVKKVTNGDLSVRNNIQSNDEIGELANSFDTMTTTLENWVDELDEKIKQKTKELQEMNETLEEKVKQEVSRNREKDKQLLQQFRLAQMGEMISMIAHQWRQPLSAITSVTIGLRMGKKEDIDPNYSKQLESIEEQVQYLSNTINDFSEYFRPYKIKEKTTFRAIFEKAYSLIDFNFKNRQIDIIRNFKNDESFETYPNELIQTVINILKNAIDNFEIKNINNCAIIVTATSNKHEHSLSILDNGGGIDSKIIDLIFDPYFSTKKEKNGTGLGLYMSKMLVEEQCGGKLNAKNLQDGVSFGITIPRESNDEQ